MINIICILIGIFVGFGCGYWWCYREHEIKYETMNMWAERMSRLTEDLNDKSNG